MAPGSLQTRFRGSGCRRMSTDTKKKSRAEAWQCGHPFSRKHAQCGVANQRLRLLSVAVPLDATVHQATRMLVWCMRLTRNFKAKTCSTPSPFLNFFQSVIGTGHLHITSCGRKIYSKTTPKYLNFHQSPL